MPKFTSLNIRSKILLGFAFPLILIGVFSFYIYLSIQSTLASANWVRHTHEVIAKAYFIEKLMMDMQAGQRGFIISGREDFLGPYMASQEVWLVEAESLHRLVSDNPPQVARAKEIIRLFNNWVEEIANPEIELRKTFDPEDASIASIFPGDKGKALMDEIRVRVQEFIQIEETLMDERNVTAQNATQTTLLAAVVGLPLLALIGIVVVIWALFKAVLTPLKQLVNATESVTGGDLSVSIDHRSRDEIGALSRSFNVMISSLKASMDANTYAQKRIEKKAEELSFANKHKSQFLANMSHEIRTPLNGIHGMLGLILRSDISEKTRHYAKLAIESADALMVIINDVLDFSKIEAGKLEVETLEFELQSFFRDFGHTIGHRAQEKGLEFVLDLVDLPLVNVAGDPGRIRQILNNLVSNAIKFTHEGEVVVRVSAEEEKAQNLHIKCSVSDTGIGISPDKISKLFQEFTQEDASTTRKYGGTGLGLAIVKQLCQIMGGDIYVKSEKGQGSTFCFDVIVKKVVGQASLPDEPHCLNQIKIYVVDPSMSHSEMLDRQLRIWKGQPTLFTSVDCAHQCLSGEQGEVAVLIIDIRGLYLVPSILLEQFQQLCRTKGMKVILMTSISGDDTGRAYFNDCYTRTVVKPVTPSDLFDALNDVLYGKVKVSSRKKTAHGGGFDQEALLNSTARVLLVEDNMFNQEVVLGYVEDLNLNVGIASNGVEAIEQLKLGAEAQPYDVVLMDCQMPEMDGYEATRLIRSGESGVPNADIPIIALTANAMKGDKEKCLAAGMNDYLSKPVLCEDLFAKLSQWVGVSSQQPKGLPSDDKNHDDAKAADAAEERMWDEEDFLKRVRNRKDRAKKLIALFITTTEEAVLEIQAEDLSYEDIGKLAHKLKGSYANISAKPLSKRCASLEAQCKSGEASDLAPEIAALVEETERFLAMLRAW